MLHRLMHTLLLMRQPLLTLQRTPIKEIHISFKTLAFCAFFPSSQSHGGIDIKTARIASSLGAVRKRLVLASRSLSYVCQQPFSCFFVPELVAVCLEAASELWDPNQ